MRNSGIHVFTDTMLIATINTDILVWFLMKDMLIR